MGNNSKTKTNWMGKMALLLIIIAIVVFGVIIVVLTSGNTTVVSSYTVEQTASSSISCKAENFAYPFFTYGNASSSTTTVNVIFNNGEAKSISLMQKMNYEDANQAVAGEALNHAAMNKSFGSELGSDALNAKYMVEGASMNMSLYLNSKSLFDAAKEYFLIERDLDGVSEYIDNYTEKGFNCEER